MHLDPAEALGLVAGFVGAFAFAPQAFKIVRDRDASGVSGLTYAMVLTGALLWGAYGVFRDAPSIVLWNAVAAGLAGTVLVLKGTRKERGSSDPRTSEAPERTRV